MGRKEQNHKLIRSTAAVSAPTLFSRIFGYIRDMLQAKYMGTGRSAEAFTIAFLIPNLLRRLTGEGAMTAAFVPVFTHYKTKKTKEELWKFANVFFFNLTIIMALLAVLGIIFSPFLVKIIAPGFQSNPEKFELTVILTRYMFPYVFLICLAALVMAILNSFHKFFIPAFTPVLFNLSIIALALILAGKAAEPAYVFAGGVLLGGICQLGLQVPFVWRQGMRFRPQISFSHPAVRQVAKLMLPGIFGAGIYQINLFISRMIASFLEEGSVPSLYYASRVQELTLGLFTIALSIALLPTFSELTAQHDIQRMKKILNFSLRMVFFVTFPAMVGLLILNRPIIQVLYQRGAFDTQSTAMTSSCLLFFALGLPFVSSVKILATAFYSLKDTKTPVYVAFFIMLLYISLSLIFMGPLRVGGIALALSVSSVFNFIGLFLLLEKKIGRIQKRILLTSTGKAVFSSGGMGLTVWYFMRMFDFSQQTFPSQLGILLAAIAIGILVYVVMNLLFNHEDLRSMKDMFSREKILEERREK